MCAVKLKNNLVLTRTEGLVTAQEQYCFPSCSGWDIWLHSAQQMLSDGLCLHLRVSNFKKLRALQFGCLNTKMHCQRGTYWETLVTKVGKIMSDLLFYGCSSPQFSLLTSPDGKYFLLIQCSMSMHMLHIHACIYAYTYICSNFYSHWHISNCLSFMFCKQVEHRLPKCSYAFSWSSADSAYRAQKSEKILSPPSVAAVCIIKLS